MAGDPAPFRRSLDRRCFQDHAVRLGSRVTLDDLDDGTREEYVLVPASESSPSDGRLSTESPVGRAIAGHHEGDVVDAHVPRGVRHLRIARLQSDRLAA